MEVLLEGAGFTQTVLTFLPGATGTTITVKQTDI